MTTSSVSPPASSLMATAARCTTTRRSRYWQADPRLEPVKGTPSPWLDSDRLSDSITADAPDDALSAPRVDICAQSKSQHAERMPWYTHAGPRRLRSSPILGVSKPFRVRFLLCLPSPYRPARRESNFVENTKEPPCVFP
jgi:hypothetical protein